MPNLNLNTAPSLRIEKHFQASAETIFEAWTKSEIIKTWLFKNDHNEIVDVKINLTPGGAFSILEQNEKGDIIDHYGRYQLIDKPNQLDFSLAVPRYFDGETRVEINIASVEDGCQMTFVQIGVNPKIVEKQWQQMFENLEQIVKSLMLSAQ